MTYPEFVAILGAVLFWGVIGLFLLDVYYTHFLYPCVFRTWIILGAQKLQADAEAIRDAEPRKEGGRYIVSTIIAAASSSQAESPESLLEQQFACKSVFSIADERIKVQKTISTLNDAGYPELAALASRAYDLKSESILYNAPIVSLVVWIIAPWRQKKTLDSILLSNVSELLSSFFAVDASAATTLGSPCRL